MEWDEREYIIVVCMILLLCGTYICITMFSIGYSIFWIYAIYIVGDYTYRRVEKTPLKTTGAYRKPRRYWIRHGKPIITYILWIGILGLILFISMFCIDQMLSHLNSVQNMLDTLYENSGKYTWYEVQTLRMSAFGVLVGIYAILVGFVLSLIALLYTINSSGDKMSERDEDGHITFLCPICKKNRVIVPAPAGSSDGSKSTTVPNCCEECE